MVEAYGKGVSASWFSDKNWSRKLEAAVTAIRADWSTLSYPFKVTNFVGLDDFMINLGIHMKPSFTDGLVDHFKYVQCTGAGKASKDERYGIFNGNGQLVHSDVCKPGFYCGVVTIAFSEDPKWCYPNPSCGPGTFLNNKNECQPCSSCPESFANVEMGSAGVPSADECTRVKDTVCYSALEWVGACPQPDPDDNECKLLFGPKWELIEPMGTAKQLKPQHFRIRENNGGCGIFGRDGCMVCGKRDD